MQEISGNAWTKGDILRPLLDIFPEKTIQNTKHKTACLGAPFESCFFIFHEFQSKKQLVWKYFGAIVEEWKSKNEKSIYEKNKKPYQRTLPVRKRYVKHQKLVHQLLKVTNKTHRHANRNFRLNQKFIPQSSTGKNLCDRLSCDFLSLVMTAGQMEVFSIVSNTMQAFLIKKSSNSRVQSAQRGLKLWNAKKLTVYSAFFGVFVAPLYTQVLRLVDKSQHAANPVKFAVH